MDWLLLTICLAYKYKRKVGKAFSSWSSKSKGKETTLHVNHVKKQLSLSVSGLQLPQPSGGLHSKRALGLNVALPFTYWLSDLGQVT